MPTERTPIITADSITRVGAEAKGAVVVNGSHGGVYAAYLAAKLGVAAAIFNDAGIGRDGAGIAGVDYLAELGIPAAAIGNLTARIGDARSTYEDGILSRINSRAAALGAAPGISAREFVTIVRHAAAEREK
jgi:hypothetical protein